MTRLENFKMSKVIARILCHGQLLASERYTEQRRSCSEILLFSVYTTGMKLVLITLAQCLMRISCFFRPPHHISCENWVIKTMAMVAHRITYPWLAQHVKPINSSVKQLVAVTNYLININFRKATNQFSSAWNHNVQMILYWSLTYNIFLLLKSKIILRNREKWDNRDRKRETEC